MNDYCIVPPFIQEIAKPNLLMIIDNSASMYDLAYVDRGRKVCSGDNTVSCDADATCSAASIGTCSVFLRNPYYCYDQTFSTANSYVGYFDTTKNYQFNFTTSVFDEVASIPANCAMAAAANVLCKVRSNVVHLNIDTADSTATKYFYASGSYLNWLTASKFDVEKQVLTGGKFLKVCSNNVSQACSVDADCGAGECGILQEESRGCVGQGYLKEALTTDFANYNSPETNNLNTALGVTFSIKGPSNPYNTTAPSQGGQTYINIYNGNYDQKECQEAITIIGTEGSSQTDWRTSVEQCLNYSSTAGSNHCSLDSSRTCTITEDCKEYTGGTQGTCTYTKNQNPNLGSVTTTPPSVGSVKSCWTASDCPNVNNYNITCVNPVPRTLANDYGNCVVPTQQPAVKTKVAYMETVQTCWSYTRNGTLGTGDVTRLTSGGKCSDIYKSMGVCSNNAALNCYVNADCGAGTCNLTGPAAILAGNPAVICGTGYLGQFYLGGAADWLDTWGGATKHCFNDTTNSIGGACASDAGCTSPATCQEDAVIQYRRFCNDTQHPTVTDPTDSPSDTSSYDNLPALISGIGVEAQLGEPILSIPVRIAYNSTASGPSGLVQEYANKIRIGLMAFNSYGSASEAPTLLASTKVCSNDSTRSCAQDLDCGSGNTCGNAADKDGAAVLSLIGKGRCLTAAGTGTGTSCTKQAHCTTINETCVSDGVGNHTTGLVKSIDDLRGTSWTPFSESYYNAIGYFGISSSDATGKTSRTDMRINADDFPDSMNPSEYVCQSNNILLVTDGTSTADQNSAKTGVVDVYKTVSGNVTGTCPKYGGSQDLDDLSWLARHRNINTFAKATASTVVPQKKNQSITSYIVFNGADNGESGDCNNTTLLTKTANNGGTDLLKTDIPSQYQETLRKAFEAVAGGTASGTAASILSNSEGSGANILQAVFYPSKEFETVSGQTVPTSASWIGEMQNLWYYVDPYIGNSSVREDTNTDKALHVINDYVTEFQFKGGETIAVLKQDADGNGSGDTVIATATDARVKNQGYCSTTTDTKCATDAGCPVNETCNIQGIVSADDIHSLWRAGRKLWSRDLATAPRTLYTYLYGTSVVASAACSGSGITGNISFTANGMVNLGSFPLQYLNPANNTWTNLPGNDLCVIVTLLQAASVAEAADILKFIQGYDHTSYDSSASAISSTINGSIPRNRSVLIGGSKKVWKLGDIIASTPRIQSFNKLNNFHLDSPAGYGDMTYANDDTGTGYANSTAYKARGMAYAGANDGLLHAFKLGSLAVSGTKTVTNSVGAETTVTITGSTKAALGGTGLGEEQWAFIPKNVLPYLKYLADPAYSHLYLVDGPTRLLDASIGYNNNSYITDDAMRAKYATAGCDATGSGEHAAYWACKLDPATESNKSWRTILIGSMGIGGATSATCKTSAGVDRADCVKTPIADVGHSSYFALDITDPASPQYLWEFSHADLGYATSGAGVSRIAHKFTAGGITFKDTNGRWLAVIGSGPTGPVDTTYHQFKGRSDHPLAVFVLDLKTGALLNKFDSPVINNAFAGSMASAPIDTDRSNKLSDGFYSDDALYFGFSNCTANCSSDTPTWNGGIMRLLTGENIDPTTWSLSTLISNIGPVTTAIGKLQDRKYKNLWLYTGSGRYFFKGDESSASGKILAVKEPCYSLITNDIYTASAIAAQSPACTTEIVFADADFADQTSAINTMVNNDGTSKKGWYISLEAQDNVNNFGAERIITEPVAMPNGAVFFTSFMPSTDICNYGGKSYMWGMKYDTGGAASSGQLQGKALVQVSTGSFEEVNLSTAFALDTGHLYRKMTAPMIGKPPTDPPPIVSTAGNKPLKRILHIQEK